ncbi:MAG: HAD family hydrolase [Deltaproteobacteria bacterium]|nr:HAD family hydrolase [Deltaproteobacteria bacterium]
MKKVVSFDLDGTLVSQEFGDMVWNHGIPLEYAKKFGVSFEEAKKFVIYEYGLVGDGDILWYDIKYWIGRLGLDVKVEDLFNRYEKHIRLVEGAKEILEKLKGKYILILSSNAARIFVEKELRYTGIESYFDYVFSATSDFKIVKKEKEFYRKVMGMLKVSPQEIIHIGDHPVFDYEVPTSLGIEAHLVKEGKGLKEVLSLI